MKNMEIPDFEYFIDREKGKPCLVAGNAPTLKNFPFRKFKGKYFLVNEGPILLRKYFISDYWLCANFMFPVPSMHFKKINIFKDCTFMFSDTAVYVERNKYDYEFLKKNLKVRWFAFDDRHFEHKKCIPYKLCCKFVDLYPKRITIHEFIQQYFNMPERCPMANTAVLHSLIFAVIAGCSPIYLQGIELPMFQKNYMHYKMWHPQMAKNLYWVIRSYFREWIHGKPQYSPFVDILEQTLAAFRYIVKLCHSRGIEIYNLSPTSLLNQIESLPYLDYRKI